MYLPAGLLHYLIRRVLFSFPQPTLPRGRGEEQTLGTMEQETVADTVKYDAMRVNEKCRSRLASSATAFTGITSGRVAGSVPLLQ